MSTATRAGTGAARELVVLGTASQVPTRARAHNGYVLRWDRAGFLFDPGEGTQRQLTYAGVAASSITHICLTHSHGDHTFGLPGVLQRMALDGARHEVTLLYPAEAEAYVDLLVRLAGPPPQLRLRRQPCGPGVAVDADGWRLVADRLDHRVPALGWRVEEKDGRRVLPDRLAAAGVRGPDVRRLLAEGSLRVDGRVVRAEDVTVPRRGQVFAFVMDTRPCAGAARLAAGADLLVCEATFLAADAQLARDYGHCTARQAAELAAAAEVRQLVLAHFSQRYGEDVAVFEAEAVQVLPGTVAARDLDRFALPARRGAGRHD
ncbi:ribonuclease Z [Motilibacter sp. K478]|nr:ribonuclease Z [Motilibacter aurantiacus]